MKTLILILWTSAALFLSATLANKSYGQSLDSVLTPIPLPPDSITATGFMMKFKIPLSAKDSFILCYEYQVATDSLFSAIVQQSGSLSIDSVACSLKRATDPGQFVTVTLPITKVEPGVSYYCRMRADVIFGGDVGPITTRYSQTQRITALKARAQAIPLLLLPTRITSGGFTLAWEPVADAQEYGVDIALDSAFGKPLQAYSDKRTREPRLRVEGLSPQTGYFWRVRSIFAAGTSAYSRIIRQETLSAPQLYTADSIGQSPAFTLSFSPTNYYFYSLKQHSPPPDNLSYIYDFSGIYNPLISSLSQVNSLLNQLITMKIPIDSALIINNTCNGTTGGNYLFGNDKVKEKFIIGR